MDNVLFKAPIIEEDRRTVSKNVLLNASRVTDFYTDNSDGYTVFHYNDVADGRDKTTEYKTSWVLVVFETIFEETQRNNFITLNIDQYNAHAVGGKPGRLTAWPYPQNKINIQLDWFIKAEARPTSETGSYVFVDRGAFKQICYRSGDTLDEINTTSSVSGSLPA